MEVQIINVTPFILRHNNIRRMDSVEQTLRRARDVEERYKLFLQRKVEQDKSIEETFKRIERTQQTLKETKQTIGTIDQLYTRLQKVMSQSIDAALKSIEKHPMFNVSQPGFEPNRADAKKVANLLKDKKRIMVLTGAGISAASGIPTFRGEDGFWKKEKVQTVQKESQKIDPQTILTNRFYQKNPKTTWKWLQDFYNLKIKAKPNKGHTALNDILEELTRRGKQVCLVTQNIDNFHSEAQQASKKTNKNYKGYPIYEIHGNILKIRCDKCSIDSQGLFSLPYQKYMDIIQQKTQIVCPKCQSPLRPHIMFFDQVYQEPINRSDTIRNFLKSVDALIVIGTALQTGLAYEIVQTTFDNEKQIIELNTSCTICRSKVWWMQGKADEHLEQIKQNIYKK